MKFAYLSTIAVLITATDIWALENEKKASSDASTKNKYAVYSNMELAREMAVLEQQLDQLKFAINRLEALKPDIESMSANFAESGKPKEAEELRSRLEEIKRTEARFDTLHQKRKQLAEKPPKDEKQFAIDSRLASDEEFQLIKSLEDQVDGMQRSIDGLKNRRKTAYYNLKDRMDDAHITITSYANRFTTHGGAMGSPAFASPYRDPFVPSSYGGARSRRSIDGLPKMNAYLRNLFGYDLDKERLKQAAREAAEELDNLGAIIETDLNLVSFKTTATQFMQRLTLAIDKLQTDRTTKEAEITTVADLFRGRDGNFSQLSINRLLVYAVYSMVAAIVILFLFLRFLDKELAEALLRQRLYMEVLSMAFLLLTVIILGTGRILTSDGAAALLGIIAGYVFARRKLQTDTSPENPVGGGGKDDKAGHHSSSADPAKTKETPAKTKETPAKTKETPGDPKPAENAGAQATNGSPEIPPNVEPKPDAGEKKP